MHTRRQFIQQLGLIGGGLAVGGVIAPTSQVFGGVSLFASRKAIRLPKLKVSMDRVIKETVGLRPFRASGFRVERQELGSKTIVHNYGHGGSGWSLSWGTGNMAADLAAATGETKFAVMGCGVVGIATARLLQMRGYSVTIYTKDLPPNVTSSKATGTWSPSYTLIEPEKITPEFKACWEKAARFSFTRYQNLLGLNDIVHWKDNYTLHFDDQPARGGENKWLELTGSAPEREEILRKRHPFKADHVYKQTTLVFNIPSYLEKHLDDFLDYGGKVEIRDFKRLEDVDALPEKCVLNCTGLGSKALFGDEELTPVSGQLSFLIPQPEFQYRLTTPGGYAIPRKDGVILGGNALKGNWDPTPSREQTQKVVESLAQVVAEMRG